MRKVRIICVGKTQDKYLQEGIAIYEKRLKRYCTFEIQVVKEANYNKASKALCLAEEGARLLKLISSKNFTVLCDEQGKSFSSPGFAQQFNRWATQGYSQFDFLIGGAYGFSPEVKAVANMAISLSAMTLTHQMIRLFLAEQIYRSFTILKGEKYHHS